MACLLALFARTSVMRVVVVTLPLNIQMLCE